MVDAKKNTGDTVIELTTALKSEQPNLTERITQPGSDMSTTCVMVWFIFAFAMFVMNF